MTLKKCTCGKIQTTKNSKFNGKGNLGVEYLLFTCCTCGSSFSVLKREDKKRLVINRVLKGA